MEVTYAKALSQNLFDGTLKKVLVDDEELEHSSSSSWQSMSSQEDSVENSENQGFVKLIRYKSDGECFDNRNSGKTEKTEEKFESKKLETNFQNMLQQAEINEISNPGENNKLEGETTSLGDMSKKNDGSPNIHKQRRTFPTNAEMERKRIIKMMSQRPRDINVKRWMPPPETRLEDKLTGKQKQSLKGYEERRRIRKEREQSPMKEEFVVSNNEQPETRGFTSADVIEEPVVASKNAINEWEKRLMHKEEKEKQEEQILGVGAARRWRDQKEERSAKQRTESQASSESVNSASNMSGVSVTSSHSQCENLINQEIEEAAVREEIWRIENGFKTGPSPNPTLLSETVNYDTTMNSTKETEELSGVVPINTQLQHTEIFSNDEVSITTDLQHDGEVDSSSQNALVTKFEENESGSDDGSEIAADADRETALKSEKDVAANTITQTDDNLATTNPANDMELIVTANVESRFQDSIITSSDSAAESRSDSGAATDLALNLSSQTELSNHPTEVTSLQTECNSTIKASTPTESSIRSDNKVLLISPKGWDGTFPTIKPVSPTFFRSMRSPSNESKSHPGDQTMPEKSEANENPLPQNESGGDSALSPRANGSKSPLRCGRSFEVMSSKNQPQIIMQQEMKEAEKREKEWRLRKMEVLHTDPHPSNNSSSPQNSVENDGKEIMIKDKQKSEKETPISLIDEEKSQKLSDQGSKPEQTKEATGAGIDEEYSIRIGSGDNAPVVRMRSNSSAEYRKNAVVRANRVPRRKSMLAQLWEAGEFRNNQD